MTNLNHDESGNHIDFSSMTKSFSKLDVVRHILQTLLPEKNPSFTGYSLNDSVFLATYKDYPNCYVTNHNSPFHTLELIDDASINLHRRLIGDHQIEMPMSSGQMYFIPHQADYFIEIDDPNQILSFTLLAFCPNALKAFALKELEYDDDIEFRLEEPKALDEQAKKIQVHVDLIKREILSGYPEGVVYLQYLVDTLMLLLINRFAVHPKKIKRIEPQLKKISPKNKKRLKSAKEYIKEHLHEQILLKDLVENLDLGLNSSGISHLFSQFEGMTFGAYLTKVRVEKAMKLLTETYYSIAQIAQECQFHDASHFCKKFKSVTNSTPGQFRKEYGKKIII